MRVEAKIKKLSKTYRLSLALVRQIQIAERQSVALKDPEIW